MYTSALPTAQVPTTSVLSSFVEHKNYLLSIKNNIFTILNNHQEAFLDNKIKRLDTKIKALERELAIKKAKHYIDTFITQE